MESQRPDLYARVSSEAQQKERTIKSLFIDRVICHNWIMTTITLQKAQQDLAILLNRALAGEEIIIETDDRQVRLSSAGLPPGMQLAARQCRWIPLPTSKRRKDWPAVFWCSTRRLLKSEQQRLPPGPFSGEPLSVLLETCCREKDSP